MHLMRIRKNILTNFQAGSSEERSREAWELEGKRVYVLGREKREARNWLESWERLDTSELPRTIIQYFLFSAFFSL